MDKQFALITGASSGIGREFAYLLAQRGYSLILVARRRELLENLAAEIHDDISEKLDIHICKADLSHREDCIKVFDLVSDLQVEVCINNAGFGDCGFFPETNLEKDLSMIDVNISAMHFFAKQMLRKMQAQGRGYILNVASSAGLIPAGPYMATYYATKAYVTSLTRAIAVELKEKNSPVYIGCLCPGPVDTQFNGVANVEFALRGISAKKCADYAIKQMFRRRTVIIPSLRMKLAIYGGRLLPQKIFIRLTGKQQKKKIQQRN